MDRLTDVFGRRLRSIRRSRGLTQEQLGQAAGLDYKHLGGIERGEHSPSFDAIEKIISVLQVPYHEMFMPDQTTAGQIEEHLQLLLQDVDRLDRAKLKQFFADLLSAIRRAREP